jgi:hypothetical protein
MQILQDVEERCPGQIEENKLFVILYFVNIVSVAELY